MKVACDKCNKIYDDEFRSTLCPHVAFYANDGKNHFKKHNTSFISGGIGRCPSCSSNNTFNNGGVNQCHDCGFSP